MKSLRIREIRKTEDGYVTIIHSDGAFCYNEKDVLLIEWQNDFFSKFIITKWAKLFFWSSVLGTSMGITMVLLGILSRNNSSKGAIWNNIENHWHYLLMFIFISYFFIRLIYFFLDRNNFQKSLLSITLKNNSRALFKDSNNYIGITINKKNGSLFRGNDLSSEIGKIIENSRRIKYRIKDVFNNPYEQEYQRKNLIFHHLFVVILIFFGSYQFIQTQQLDYSRFFETESFSLNLFIRGYAVVSVVFIFLLIFLFSIFLSFSAIIGIFTSYLIGYLILCLMLLFKINGTSTLSKIECIENRTLRLIISLITGLFFFSVSIILGYKIGFHLGPQSFGKMGLIMLSTGAISFLFLMYVNRNQKMKNRVEKLLNIMQTSEWEKNGTWGIVGIPSLLIYILFIQTASHLNSERKKKDATEI